MPPLQESLLVICYEPHELTQLMRREADRGCREQDLGSNLAGNPMMIMAPPLSYLEMIRAEKGARLIITESGGAQKEAYFFRKPCLVLRAETEWTELVQAGAAMLVDADQEKIQQAFQHYYDRPPEHFPGLFGDGDASGAICRVLVSGKF